MHPRDSEDVTQQIIRAGQAREALAAAVDALGDAAAGEGEPALSVRRECDALVRVLRSRAKRPPAVDTAPLLGALSAADREHGATFSWQYDLARGRFRDAETALDHAAYDLSTARGEDG